MDKTERTLGESDGKKENMKKRYTKKQITEAIARWKRTLRRMDEDGDA